MSSNGYCEIPAVTAGPEAHLFAAPGQAVAACMQCGEPTEYRFDAPGVVQCPRCEWQQAQRSACSG